MYYLLLLTIRAIALHSNAKMDLSIHTNQQNETKPNKKHTLTSNKSATTPAIIDGALCKSNWK
jgi:predicted RNA-binding protein with RPS1 domain